MNASPNVSSTNLAYLEAVPWYIANDRAVRHLKQLRPRRCNMLYLSGIESVPKRNYVTVNDAARTIEIQSRCKYRRREYAKSCVSRGAKKFRLSAFCG